MAYISIVTAVHEPKGLVIECEWRSKEKRSMPMDVHLLDYFRKIDMGGEDLRDLASKMCSRFGCYRVMIRRQSANFAVGVIRDDYL